MRFILRCQLKNNNIPLDYRRVCLSFFKKALSEAAEGKYFDEYFLNNQRRPFTFSVQLPSPKFSKENIILDKNEMKIIFSTGDTKTGFIFCSSFIAQKNKKFNLPFENTMTLKNVFIVPDKEVTGNEMMVKTLSPLCLREHNNNNKDIYYSVKSDNFNEKAVKIIVEQLKNAGFSKTLIENFSISPINARKAVVKHYNCYIECSLGDFAIHADKAILNYILKYGLGSRKSAGFGFVDLLSEK